MRESFKVPELDPKRRRARRVFFKIVNVGPEGVGGGVVDKKNKEGELWPCLQVRKIVIYVQSN